MRLVQLSRVILLMSALTASCLTPATGFSETTVRPIAIVSAQSYETHYLKAELKDPVSQSSTRNIYTFTEGTIAGKPVVIAQIGIGEINAAVGTALLIEKYNPQEIIITGVAGGTHGTSPGSIVVADKVINYSFGFVNQDDQLTISPTYQPDSDFHGSDYVRLNPLYFSTSSRLNALAMSTAKTLKLPDLQYEGHHYPIKIISGTVATTQRFIDSNQAADKLHSLTNAVAIDMESAGMAQVAHQEKIPFMVIRAISDDGSLEMFKQLSKITAKDAQKLILAMLTSA